MKRIVYHGTAASALPAILKHGLWPREKSGHDGNYDGNQISFPDLVYVTTHYAPFYGAIAAQYQEETHMALLKLEVHEEDILPDEDFLLVVGVNKRATDKKTPNPRDFPHLGIPCLERMGTASHAYAIPRSNIKGSIVVPLYKDEDPFWLGHLGGETSNCGIAYGGLLSFFDKYRDRTELFFTGGIEAVEADIEREQEERRKEYLALGLIKLP